MSHLKNFITDKLEVYIDYLKQNSEHRDLIYKFNTEDYKYMINFFIENEADLFTKEFYIHIMADNDKHQLGSIRFDKIEFRDYKLMDLV